MQHIGQVVSLQANVATVRFTRTKTCEKCGACMYFGDTEAQVELANTLNAQVGEYVEVQLTAKRFLQASLLAYILPLCLLIAGIAIGSLWSEVMGVVCGLAGAGIAFFVFRALEPRLSKKRTFQPEMIGITGPPAAPEENNTI